MLYKLVRQLIGNIDSIFHHQNSNYVHVCNPHTTVQIGVCPQTKLEQLTMLKNK